MPSSMVGWGSDNYKPGASLKAWRDFFPNAIVHGIDIASDTLMFEEERIIVHERDSTSPDQAAKVIGEIAPAPDLIIDDGLHLGHAQIATLKNFYPCLRPDAVYIVEDVIPSSALEITAVAEQLDPNADIFVDRPWGDCVAIVIRKSASNS